MKVRSRVDKLLSADLFCCGRHGDILFLSFPLELLLCFYFPGFDLEGPKSSSVSRCVSGHGSDDDVSFPAASPSSVLSFLQIDVLRIYRSARSLRTDRWCVISPS
ncbi:hypothetical protein OPV22_023351 [Ensete ventricosum]|uniref:Uncharacterized protein n=1 Tax=Ensete ventricosum TaxID=4639 RepID=A0AAV8QRU1_ENSVE|nr:hypothetical protein OPV22_023351 [Ensete ventricosum]